VGVSRLNIWLSGIGDPCGIAEMPEKVTILDCHGILRWRCGRYLNDRGVWTPVPHGEYRYLPMHCGHLQVELPPGCYSVVAGGVFPHSQYIHFNGATHVGIVEVCCEATACVKLYNPSLRLCWDGFRHGLLGYLSAGGAEVNRAEAEELLDRTERLLVNLPRPAIEAQYAELFEGLRQQGPEKEA
jgi:hypothetical protein